ncbi:MAG: hypothetical protein ABH956_00745 [Candidatus Nealsonbacteria bacterium]
MIKKILIISFLGLFVFSPFIVNAQTRSGCPTQGLVPCGGSSCPCKLCDFFKMIERIVDFILFGIVPALAALMIAIGGFMYIFAYLGVAGGGPEMLSTAKNVFKAVILGLLIVYGAWLIINTFFMVIGVADWTGLRQGWWTINCN